MNERVRNRPVSVQSELENKRTLRRSIDVPVRIRRTEYSGVPFSIAVVIARSRNIGGNSERHRKERRKILLAPENEPLARGGAPYSDVRFPVAGVIAVHGAIRAAAKCHSECTCCRAVEPP